MINKQKNPLKNIKNLVVGNKTDKSIGIDSLKKLYNFDFEMWKESKAYKYRRAIDLFLFQFAIGDHNFVDITLLKWENLKEGRISFQRNKNRQINNGGVIINNKLFDLGVIDRYGVKDTERIFLFIPEPIYENNNLEYKNYQYNSHNRLLKIVREKLNIPEVIMSKRSRYAFNTIAGNLLISRDIIEELQGHSQSSISHGYYGGTFNEIKDAEHLKVIQYVFGQKEIETN